MAAARRILSLTTTNLDSLREILELISEGDLDIDHRLVRRSTNLLRAMEPEKVPLTDLAVLLTLSEARGLSKVASHGLGDSRVMDVIFDTDTKREVAARGGTKLKEALAARMTCRGEG